MVLLIAGHLVLFVLRNGLFAESRRLLLLGVVTSPKMENIPALSIVRV
jgi:hypothetical protein